MSIETVKREDITEEYMKAILDREPHDHEIVEKENGTLFVWKANSTLRFLVDNKIVDLTIIVNRLEQNGFGKNSEPYRRLYRDLGYSLRAYWEVFYWELNNDKTDEYVYGSVTG